MPEPLRVTFPDEFLLDPFSTAEQIHAALVAAHGAGGHCQLKCTDRQDPSFRQAKWPVRKRPTIRSAGSIPRRR